VKKKTNIELFLIIIKFVFQ